MDNNRLKDVIESISGISHVFTDAGFQLFLVGGVVRDLLSDSDISDIDLTTSALPADMKKILSGISDAIWTQGEEFGTIGCIYEGLNVEITTFRADTYQSHSRNPQVKFGDNVIDDLSRRDFTINAIALDLATDELVDPFSGVDHLKEKVLQTPQDPDVSFTDDPLRILRAARFISRFELTPQPELIEAAKKLSSRIEIVSVERISIEFEKLIRTDRPLAGLVFLSDVKIFDYILNHLGDDKIGTKVSAGLERIDSAKFALSRRVLFLDLVGDQEATTLKQLKYSTNDIKKTQNFLSHLSYVLENDVSPYAVRKVVHKIGYENTEAFLDLLANHPEADFVNFSSLFKELDSSEGLSDLEIPVSGSDIIKHLDVEGGPMIGQLQKYLQELRYEKNLTKEEALSEAKSKYFESE